MRPILTRTDTNDNPNLTSRPLIQMNWRPVFSDPRNPEVWVMCTDPEVTGYLLLDKEEVYKQFYRLCYAITVKVRHKVHQLMTVSLPFTFMVNEAEILDHIGAVLWYRANAQMYCGDFQCPESLPVKRVIETLDSVVQFVPGNQRPLKERDKVFLQSRLPVENNEVSINGFLKRKMHLSIDESGKKDKKERFEPTSFHTWFHGCVTIISQLTEKQWVCGNIYGFCYLEESKAILKNMANNTALLRFSVSKVENPYERAASTYLALDVKVPETFNREDGFLSIPFLGESFQQTHGLSLIRNLKPKDDERRQIVHYLCKDDCSFYDLTKVQQKCDEQMIYSGYQTMLKKFTNLIVASTEERPRCPKRQPPDTLCAPSTKRSGSIISCQQVTGSGARQLTMPEESASLLDGPKQEQMSNTQHQIPQMFGTVQMDRTQTQLQNFPHKKRSVGLGSLESCYVKHQTKQPFQKNFSGDSLMGNLPTAELLNEAVAPSKPRKPVATLKRMYNHVKSAISLRGTSNPKPASSQYQCNTMMHRGKLMNEENTTMEENAFKLSAGCSKFSQAVNGNPSKPKTSDGVERQGADVSSESQSDTLSQIAIEVDCKVFSGSGMEPLPTSSLQQSFGTQAICAPEENISLAAAVTQKSIVRSTEMVDQFPTGSPSTRNKDLHGNEDERLLEKDLMTTVNDLIHSPPSITLPTSEDGQALNDDRAMSSNRDFALVSGKDPLLSFAGPTCPDSLLLSPLPFDSNSNSM